MRSVVFLRFSHSSFWKIEKNHTILALDFFHVHTKRVKRVTVLHDLPKTAGVRESRLVSNVSLFSSNASYYTDFHSRLISPVVCPLFVYVKTTAVYVEHVSPNRQYKRLTPGVTSPRLFNSIFIISLKVCSGRTGS